MPQVRTQRRQLSAALELQQQAREQEQARLRERVQRTREANQQARGGRPSCPDPKNNANPNHQVEPEHYP